jgi:tRNA threonylcarbamoyladenosine biosynthesis protein TsaB
MTLHILALDTALGATSAAILDVGADRVLAMESAPMERGHSEALMAMVQRVLAASGLQFAEIDRFAVTTGPGSFTGLRIGIAAARGFALVHGKPAVGVSTLAAFAAPLLFGQERKPVAAAIDARHGMVFFQSLAIGGRTMAGPGLFSLEDAARKIGDGAVAFVGNAADRLAMARKGVTTDFRSSAGIVNTLPAPDIVWVARLGAAADPMSAPAKPLYLREANVTVTDRARLQRA